MPHFIVEYSANVIEKNKLEPLLLECNTIIAKHLPLPTTIEGCKARAIECQTYCVGKGEAKHAFVHVTVKILPGRTAEIQAALADALMHAIKNYFQTSLKELKLQITLEVAELSKHFLKVASE